MFIFSDHVHILPLGKHFRMPLWCVLVHKRTELVFTCDNKNTVISQFTIHVSHNLANMSMYSMQHVNCVNSPCNINSPCDINSPSNRCRWWWSDLLLWYHCENLFLEITISRHFIFQILTTRGKTHYIRYAMFEVIDILCKFTPDSLIKAFATCIFFHILESIHIVYICNVPG